MNRSRILSAVGITLVITLAGCGSDTEPTVAAPAPAATSAAPTAAAIDTSRQACTMLSALDNVDFDPAKNRAVGEAATKASNPGIATAGSGLIEAANRPDAEVPGDGPLAIAEAQLDLAEACSSLYGDSNW